MGTNIVIPCPDVCGGFDGVHFGLTAICSQFQCVMVCVFVIILLRQRFQLLTEGIKPRTFLGSQFTGRLFE